MGLFKGQVFVEFSDYLLTVRYLSVLCVCVCVCLCLIINIYNKLIDYAFIRAWREKMNRDTTLTVLPLFRTQHRSR